MLKQITCLNFVTSSGLLFFLLILAAGYYFSITFVQLGIEEYAKNQLTLEQSFIGFIIALLAVITAASSLITGGLMHRYNLLKNLRQKLWALAFVVIFQALLVWTLFVINSLYFFILWIIILSIILGFAIPVTYTLFVYFVPRFLRGGFAALATGLTYITASGIPMDWQMEVFVDQLKFPLVLSAIGLISFLCFRPKIISKWQAQSDNDEFSVGRFAEAKDKIKFRTNIIIALLLVGGIFFIDSLGFLKLINTPEIVKNTWQSADLSVHLILALAHAMGALIGGILYSKLRLEQVFIWVFGIFALVHFSFSLNAHAGIGFGQALVLPFLYAFAVSVYTVVNFAVWPDLSNKENIAIISTLGIAVSGWMATFLSTSLYFNLASKGLSFYEYINIVDSVAISFLLIGALILYIRPIINKYL
jgi:MFS family permease